MKRTITFLLVAIMLIGTISIVSAFDKNDTSVVYEEESGLTEEEQKEILLKTLKNGGSYEGYCDNGDVSTQNWKCFFKHDTEDSVVAIIQHRIRPEVPRCYRTYYLVTKCKNCSYETGEKLSEGYINCHAAGT